MDFLQKALAAIRGIGSQVRTAVGGGFAEYIALVESIDRLRATGSALIQSATSAFASNFDSVADGQPSPIKEDFKRLIEAGRRQISVMNDLHAAAGGLLQDVGALKALFDEQARRDAELKAMEGVVSSDEAAVGEVEAAIRTAASGLDRARLDEAQKQAEAKLASSRARLEAMRAAHAVASVAYRRRFVEKAGELLENAVTLKLRSLEKLEPVGTRIEGVGGGIVGAQEDPAVTRYRQRLGELEAQIQQMVGPASVQ